MQFSHPDILTLAISSQSGRYDEKPTGLSPYHCPPQARTHSKTGRGSGHQTGRKRQGNLPQTGMLILSLATATHITPFRCSTPPLLPPEATYPTSLSLINFLINSSNQYRRRFQLIYSGKSQSRYVLLPLPPSPINAKCTHSTSVNSQSNGFPPHRTCIAPSLKLVEPSYRLCSR
jgi:hypothetical protein